MAGVLAMALAIGALAHAQRADAAGTLMDSRNAWCSGGDHTRYSGAVWWAIPYAPRHSYRLERVEFMHGGVGADSSGTVQFAIHINTPEWPPYEPTPGPLATGSHALHAAVKWQGGDISPPLDLDPRYLYWIVLRPVLGSQRSTGWLSFCIGGEQLWNRSDDGIHWTLSGPGEALPWMLRFYGTESTRIEPTTWTAIRRLYGEPHLRRLEK